MTRAIIASIALTAGCAADKVTHAPEPVAAVTISPSTDTLSPGAALQLAAVARNASGAAESGHVFTWSTSDTAVAKVSSTGLATAIAIGSATITATSEGHAGTAAITVDWVSLPIRGLYVQFERRGWPSEYWPGQVIQSFDQFDGVVGRTVSAEVAAQLDSMRRMGVNAIAYELRTAD